MVPSAANKVMEIEIQPLTAPIRTPLRCYQTDLERPEFSFDPAQQDAMVELERVFHQLLEQGTQPSRKGLLSWFGKTEQTAVQGLYLWGGVGRGKTYLVDTFYNCLPIEKKLRIHFHRFMQRVHQELKTLEQQQDPLKIVARRLRDEARVICFDEFFVSDITDAMILAELLRELFASGVTLVATSNMPPDELYRNGLQRARFLPAIELIKRHCDVLKVDGGVDYRLRTLEQAEIYHSPLDPAAGENLKRYFAQLAPEAGHMQGQIEVNSRHIPYVALADDVLWCSFSALCQSARSASDYIELSREYHTVLLEGVQPMGGDSDDTARRFIALVDEFYERKVKLIISAAVPMGELYGEGRLNFEFRRCLSRLKEMQSLEYLATPHEP